MGTRISDVACVVWLASMVACQSSGPEYRVVESEFVEFEDIFTAVDTIRFDASVLIGEIGFVDLSDEGEFIVTDFTQRVIYIFSNSGRHIRTIEMLRCNPEDDGRILSAKFLTNGEMIVTSPWGVYNLNADGSCKQRLIEILPNNSSFCERQDTVYFFDNRGRPPMIYGYSVQEGTVREYELRKPKFPRTTGVKIGYDGRGIACFDRGIFYRYAEGSDGAPLWTQTNPVIHQPKSYRPPERDMTSQGFNNMNSELIELCREFTYSEGLFELDESHRMVTFQHPTEINMSIVNMDTETSVSTSTGQDFFIHLVKDGLVYVAGDYEQLASGEVGNSMLYVWQFHPFESHSKTSDG
ncbi:MAG: hypothetical protein OXF06_02280 [Bacteroidetes bacterium]|nr:hypothetical protein [Bacteroidota bacterium]